jgi:hypothetical protein
MYRRNNIIVIAAFFLAASLSSCIIAPDAVDFDRQSPPSGPPQIFIETELYFGLSQVDGTIISDREWQDFVDRYITPRFREGLTIIDAAGQWQGQTGQTIHEPSKIVIIYHHRSYEAERAIESVRADYKALFHQESVMRVSEATEVWF